MPYEDKSPEIVDFLDSLTGGDYSKGQKTGTCVWCKSDVHDHGFRDDLSLTEFGISGLCQECQDKVFGVDEVDDEPSCPEPDGNRIVEDDTVRVPGDGPLTAHDVMLRHDGMCPWCGEVA